MTGKLTMSMIIAIVALASSSCFSQSAVCCDSKELKTGCCKNRSISKNSRKMSTQSETCPNCGKTSCDASCSSNTINRTANDGKRLKSLIPSCSLSDAAIVARKHELKERGVFNHVSEIKELADGYDFIFAESKRFSQELLDYVNFERNCCSDFSFSIEFEPNLGPVHLKIFGSPSIKSQMKNAIEELQIGDFK